jgi:hypothetical protein
VPTQNASCHSRAVNTELHRFSRDKCLLPRSKFVKLRGHGDSNPTAPTMFSIFNRLGGYAGRFAKRDERLSKVQSGAKDYRPWLTRGAECQRPWRRSFVTGISVEKLTILSKSLDGKNLDHRVRFTDTWILLNSLWKCVGVSPH